MFDLVVRERIATITLCNPPVNALSRPWADAFNSALDMLNGRVDWRVLRVRSSLKVFSAGGDVKHFAARLDLPNAGDLLAEEAAIYQSLFERIERLPQISIAEIHGVAAGGGYELALACDLRIASTEARVGLPEVGLGLLPSAGGTQRMTRLVGEGRALRFIGGADLISGEEAERLGLVEWALAPEGFATAAEAIAQQYADQPLLALQTAKSCIRAVRDPSRNGFAEEAAAPRRLMAEPETRAKIEGFVARAKRSP